MIRVQVKKNLANSEQIDLIDAHENDFEQTNDEGENEINQSDLDNDTHPVIPSISLPPHIGFEPSQPGCHLIVIMNLSPDPVVLM